MNKYEKYKAANKLKVEPVLLPLSYWTAVAPSEDAFDAIHRLAVRMGIPLSELQLNLINRTDTAVRLGPGLHLGSWTPEWYRSRGGRMKTEVGEAILIEVSNESI